MEGGYGFFSLLEGGESIFFASLWKPHNCLQMFILQPPLFQSRMCPPLKLFCIVLNTSYLQLAYLELRWTENVNINYVKSAHFRILGTSGHVIYLPRILKLNAVFLIAEDNLRQGLAQGCKKRMGSALQFGAAGPNEAIVATLSVTANAT